MMVRARIALIFAILPMATALHAEISPSNKMPRRDPAADLSLTTPSTSVSSTIKQQLSIANLTQSYNDDVRATYECAYARMINPTFCAVSFVSGAISYLPGVSVTSSASPSLFPGGSNTAITFSMSVVNENPRYANALSTSALESAASSATANSFVAQMVHVIGGSEHTAGVVVTLPSTSQVVMQSPDVSVGTTASAPPTSPAPPVASFAVTLMPAHFLGVLCIAFAMVLH